MRSTRVTQEKGPIMIDGYCVKIFAYFPPHWRRWAGATFTSTLDPRKRAKVERLTTSVLSCASVTLPTRRQLQPTSVWALARLGEDVDPLLSPPRGPRVSEVNHDRASKLFKAKKFVQAGEIRGQRWTQDRKLLAVKSVHEVRQKKARENKIDTISQTMRFWRPSRATTF